MILKLVIPILIGLGIFLPSLLFYYFLSKEISKRAKQRIIELQNSDIPRKIAPEDDEERRREILEKIKKNQRRERTLYQIGFVICAVVAPVSCILFVVKPYLISIRGFTIYDLYQISVIGLSLFALQISCKRIK